MFNMVSRGPEVPDASLEKVLLVSPTPILVTAVWNTSVFPMGLKNPCLPSLCKIVFVDWQ